MSEKEVNKMVNDMSDFSEKHKLSETDLPEITKQLKNILILEKVDDTRSGPFELTESYTKNKTLYQKALKTFKKSEQKELQKILDMVEDLEKNGNG